MYQKILAPLDGSEISERSLEHVKTIAIGCHVSEVILLGVVEPVPQAGEISGLLGSEWELQAEKQALDWLKGYLIKLSDKLGGEGVNAKVAVAHGKAADEILDYSSENNIDLIIMSTHGRSGIARWAMGSVADKVARHARAPVLIIPPQGSRSGK
jgi:nucleotide-binding universal stress UspA family protein